MRFPSLLLLSAFLVLSTSAAAQQLGLSPEVRVSDPLPTAVGSEDSVIVATNEGFIDFWTWTQTPGGLRATRIAADGRKIDRFGVSLSTGKVDHSRPAVVFNGSTVVVFWNYFGVLYATEITPELEIVQSERVIGNVGGYTPAVAWNGSRYLLMAGSARIVLGRSLDVISQGRRVDAMAGTDEVALASNGDGFVVVGLGFEQTGGSWHPTAIAQQLLSDGTSAGDPVVLDANLGSADYRRRIPSITSSGSGYVVAWNRGNLELARLEVPLRVTARAEIVAAGNGESIAPVVASLGSRVVATWMAKDDPSNPGLYDATIRSAVFPADLSSVPAAGNTIGTVQWDSIARSSIAAKGGSAFVTCGLNVHDALTPGDNILVSAAAAFQTNPAAARSADESATAWIEQGKARFARTTTEGPLDGAGIVIGDASDVGMATDGRDFLLVTALWQAVSARIVRSGGIVESPVQLGPASSSGILGRISVAWDGQEYVVVWVEQKRIAIVRLNRDAAVLATSEIDTVTGFAALACSNGQCVVAWPGAGILAARMNRYTVVDQTPVQIANGTAIVHDISVALNGGDALVAWSEVTSNHGPWIFGMRVRAAHFRDGAVVGTEPGDDGFPINLPRGSAFLCGLKPLGTGFAMLWRDSHLFLTPIDSTGTTLTTIDLSPDLGPLFTVYDAALGDPSAGRLPIASSRQTNDTFFGPSLRVFYRETTPGTARTRAVRPSGISP